jgi:hypothetical protein
MLYSDVYGISLLTFLNDSVRFVDDEEAVNGAQ